jgi:hypothetical protein
MALTMMQGRGWYDNGNAYNIDDENTTLEFPHWKEKGSSFYPPPRFVAFA